MSMRWRIDTASCTGVIHRPFALTLPCHYHNGMAHKGKDTHPTH